MTEYSMKITRQLLSKVSIQVKIIGLVIALIVLIVSSITVMFTLDKYREDIRNAEEIALQTANALSYMPIIQNALPASPYIEEVRSVVENIRQDIHASAIIITGRDNVFLIDAPNKLPHMGEMLEGNISGTALLYGNSYVKTVGEGKDALLVAVSAINIDYETHEKVEGTVMVVYEMSLIMNEIIRGMQKIILSSLGPLLFGIFGSWVLARDIRKDTLGLEPKVIATLYRERIAVFQSIRDGLIVADENDEITMMNLSAKRMLDIEKSTKNQNLGDILKSEESIKIVHELKKLGHVEFSYNGKMLIADSQSVFQDKKKIGNVYSLRDKTDIIKMATTLTEVRQYSEDLRAQTHEFNNKLHILFGFLQLRRIDDAINFIKEVSVSQQVNSDIFENKIRDENVQAILLGKIAKASERKTKFSISPDSSLDTMPSHIELLPLLTIVGNLIDNAFDAVKQISDGNVSFFATDLGNDIIFEVTDNGLGISEENLPLIFKKGYSGKGENRGFGLNNVMQEIERLDGEIEVTSDVQKGATFTVFLPKEKLRDKVIKEDIE